MSDLADRPFPRGALVGAALLIAFAIGAAGIGRLAGGGRSAEGTAPAVERLSLRFEDRADGGVAVVTADEGRLVTVLEPGTHGFVRGVLRSLVRERRASALGAAEAFELARSADGHLSLHDPATGRRIDLGAFGPTNAAAFARLLPAASATP